MGLPTKGHNEVMQLIVGRKTGPVLNQLRNGLSLLA